MSDEARIHRRIVWLYAVASRATHSVFSCDECRRCCEDRWCLLVETHARNVWNVDLSGLAAPHDGDPETRPPRFIGEHDACVVPPHLRPVCALFACWYPTGSEMTRTRALWWRRYIALRRALVRAEMRLADMRGVVFDPSFMSAGISPSLYTFAAPTTYEAHETNDPQ